LVRRGVSAEAVEGLVELVERDTGARSDAPRQRLSRLVEQARADAFGPEARFDPGLVDRHVDRRLRLLRSGDAALEVTRPVVEREAPVLEPGLEVVAGEQTAPVAKLPARAVDLRLVRLFAPGAQLVESA